MNYNRFRGEDLTVNASLSVRRGIGGLIFEGDSPPSTSARSIGVDTVLSNDIIGIILLHSRTICQEIDSLFHVSLSIVYHYSTLRLSFQYPFEHCQPNCTFTLP
jgi:hypothetical protein